MMWQSVDAGITHWQWCSLLATPESTQFCLWHWDSVFLRYSHLSTVLLQHREVCNSMWLHCRNVSEGVRVATYCPLHLAGSPATPLAPSAPPFWLGVLPTSCPTSAFSFHPFLPPLPPLLPSPCSLPPPPSPLHPSWWIMPPSPYSPPPLICSSSPPAPSNPAAGSNHWAGWSGPTAPAQLAPRPQPRRRAASGAICDSSVL